MIAILILLGLIVVAALFGILATRGDGKEDAIRVAGGSCATCDGMDGMCEQECVMVASTREIEYFDDEELDRFQGRPSNQYTDAEAGEFSSVLETMRPEEVKDWNRSLILRGINLPDQLKDEVIMLIANR